MVLTVWEFGNKAEKILIISYSNQVHHFIITSAYVGCLYQVSNDIIKSGFLPFKFSRTIAMISDIEMIGKDENYFVLKVIQGIFWSVCSVVCFCALRTFFVLQIWSALWYLHQITVLKRYSWPRTTSYVNMAISPSKTRQERRYRGFTTQTNRKIKVSRVPSHQTRRFCYYMPYTRIFTVTGSHITTQFEVLKI